MKVTAHWLSEVTGKHRMTVKKHLADLAADGDGKYDSAKALQLLYVGDTGPTHSEALRKLAIAKEASEREREKALRMANALTEQSQVNVEDVYEIYAGAFVAIREKILASGLTDDEKENLLRDLQSLKTANLSKLGRDALWKEFEASLTPPNG